VAALNDEITHREQALVQAGEADREALTRWQLQDGKGARPEPTAPAIEEEIATKKADGDAAIAASERVYEDKARYVEKNRRRLVREAEKATREARERYERAIEEAAQARADVVASRQAALWASFFPGELMTHLPDMAAIATALRKPVEAALQVTTRLAADGIFRVLRSDAEILATSMTRDQALELGVARADETAVATWQTGKPDYVGPNFGAAWVGSAEEKAIAERVRNYSEQLGRRLRGDSG
jgi:G:T/U-mismatch repair DNA glycosylase